MRFRVTIVRCPTLVTLMKKSKPPLSRKHQTCSCEIPGFSRVSWLCSYLNRTANARNFHSFKVPRTAGTFGLAVLTCNLRRQGVGMSWEGLQMAGEKWRKRYQNCEPIRKYRISLWKARSTLKRLRTLGSTANVAQKLAARSKMLSTIL